MDAAPLLSGRPSRRKTRGAVGAVLAFLTVAMITIRHRGDTIMLGRATFDREVQSLTHDEILEYLTLADETYTYCTIESALCHNAVCTLNSDKLTANCGCLSMPKNASNPAQFTLGWSSFVLATSSIFQRGLRDIADYGGLTAATSDALCAASEDGSLWADVATGSSEGGFGWAGKLAATSWNSVTDTYFDDENPAGEAIVQPLRSCSAS